MNYGSVRLAKSQPPTGERGMMGTRGKMAEGLIPLNIFIFSLC